MPTELVAQALRILRDGSQFQWFVIPLFAFVVYVYVVETERQNWNLIFEGLAFWGMDWFNLGARYGHHQEKSPHRGCNLHGSADRDCCLWCDTEVDLM